MSKMRIVWIKRHLKKHDSRLNSTRRQRMEKASISSIEVKGIARSLGTENKKLMQ
ncbi:MAG: hypothetical protein K2K63_02070 [Acetatifactor sp.]|nr:hypothetical protein [Acetatifactor sp.]